MQEGENVKAKQRSASTITWMFSVLRYTVLKCRYNMFNGRDVYFNSKFARSLHSIRNVPFQLLGALPRNAALVAIETVRRVRHVKFIYADCPHNWFSILWCVVQCYVCYVVCSVANLTLLRYNDSLHRNRVVSQPRRPVCKRWSKNCANSVIP